MSIRKDKTSGIWQVDFRAPSGERIRCSAETSDRKAAQEYHDRLKAQAWRQAKLGETPDKTFQEAALRFLRESANQRDYASKVRHIAYWRRCFENQTLRSLTADAIVDALPTHRVHKMTTPRPLTPATLNRYLATIKRMLNLCVGWGWLDSVPRLPIYREPDVRVRWEPPEVIAALIRAIPVQWMKDAVLVAVSTGLRESELFALGDTTVDLPQRNAWVTHDNAKSGRARSVPLNDDAHGVLTRRLADGATWAFTRRRSARHEPRRVFRHDTGMFDRACAKIGLEDFHWHDLRHTWASWHVQRGTPLMVVKELGGWETIEMVQKYAHLAPSHVAAHAATVNFWSNSTGQEKTPLVKAA